MNRNTLLLLGVLVVLGLAAFLLMQRPGEQSVSESTSPVLFEIDSVAVDRIEVRTPSTAVVLEKQGAEWMLIEPLRYRADQTAVTSFVHQIRNIRSKAVVSTNPEKQSVFQVDSSGTTVKVFERGAERASMIVGKMGPSYLDVYLRIPPSNEVLLVDAALSSLTNKQVRDWRDRTILALPKEGIKEIKFQYGDTTFTLTLRDSVWLVGGQKTEEWVVNSLIGALASFQADEFVDTPPARIPRFTAIIEVGGTQVRFAPQKGSDKFFVQSSLSPQWYEVQQWRANQVLKRKKELLKSGS